MSDESTPQPEVATAPQIEAPTTLHKVAPVPLIKPPAPQQAEQSGQQARAPKGKEKKRKTPEEIAKEKEEWEEKKAKREADRKDRLAKKVERASRPDTVVIARTTIDTNEMADLVGANDRLMNQLRRKIGFVKALTPEKFSELFARSQEIKKNIHDFNKELARITGDKYVAPRGYFEGRQE
jgi:alanyl-tRNA synthetase